MKKLVAAIFFVPLIYIGLIGFSKPGFSANITLLSAILVMAGFLFPTLYKTLGDEKTEPGEPFAIFLAFMISISLIFALMPLVFNVDTYLSSFATLSFLALALVFLAMAYRSMERLK